MFVVFKMIRSTREIDGLPKSNGNGVNIYLDRF